MCPYSLTLRTQKKIGVKFISRDWYILRNLSSACVSLILWQRTDYDILYQASGLDDLLSKISVVVGRPWRLVERHPWDPFHPKYSLLPNADQWIFLLLNVVRPCVSEMLEMWSGISKVPQKLEMVLPMNVPVIQNLYI